MVKTYQERRYDIDWLRAIAFGVLVLYHIGMYYVADWGWHIKSEQTSTWLQELMVLTNSWRMSLLFFISAIALALTQHRYTQRNLIKIKSKRLLIPLIFGMFFIVTPQVYIEALSQQLIAPGYIEFWVDYANPKTDLLKEHHSPIGLLTWNHLWFLPYLWCYCVLFILLRQPLYKIALHPWLKKLPAHWAILSVISFLVLIWLMLRQQFPTTHALLDDWYNHGKYMLVFGFGYCFALQKKWWLAVIEKRQRLLFIAIVTYAFIVADRQQLFPFLSDHFETNLAVKILYGYIFSFNIWCWILCVVGYAGYWLNHPHKHLGYINEAILPWYILHQTLIIIFAWWLKPFGLNISLESALLLSLTITGCFTLYLVIKRVRWLGWCFGLK
jgi:glucans biosynthesis protein C